LAKVERAVELIRTCRSATMYASSTVFLIRVIIRSTNRLKYEIRIDLCKHYMTPTIFHDRFLCELKHLSRDEIRALKIGKLNLDLSPETVRYVLDSFLTTCKIYEPHWKREGAVTKLVINMQLDKG
jgi:hypothetical protein